MKPMAAIQTINLTKSYKTNIAVNSLNLMVLEGELFALLGVNGAGKTTTIKWNGNIYVKTIYNRSSVAHSYCDAGKL
jgi:ABC-type multidrug transport system ATPase subunit